MSFYSFAINEYHYKRIPFYKHRTIESASRHIRKTFKYKGSAVSDYEYVELTKERLEKWAKDCFYEIDWQNQVLVYKGD